MTDYPAFLAARLDELESSIEPVGWTGEYETYMDEYLAADIAAKRAILDDHYELQKRLDNSTDLARPHFLGRFTQSAHDIKILCRSFADHPDYKGEEG